MALSPREKSGRVARQALLAVATLGLLAAPAAAEVHWQRLPSPPSRLAISAPPLPPASEYPIQLVLDNGTADASLGVSGDGGARQFLWFNRFSVPGPFLLRQVWVLFPAGDQIAPGLPVQLALYRDADGDPANGATLIQAWNETIQVADGATFSVYDLAVPLLVDGGGDLLVGVVPRFIVSGVTPATAPAALDTSAVHQRSWLAVWSGDPPDPPVLEPLPDGTYGLVDDYVAGTWMIRAFGTAAPVVVIPTLGGIGAALLAALLAIAAAVAMRR